LGDDLTKLPESRKSLVKNPEVLKLSRLASTNQARLDGFDPQISTAQSANLRALSEDLQSLKQLEPKDSKRVYQESVQVCKELGEKRRIVMESSLRQKVEDSEDRYKSCVKVQAKEKKLDFLAISAAEGGKPNQWTLQTWVLEQGHGDIYVAVVNAGQQDQNDSESSVPDFRNKMFASDPFSNINKIEPATVQISLNKLKTLHQSPRIKELRGMQYRVRDLWNKKDLSGVSFQGNINSSLGIHDSLLLKFSPIQEPSTSN
jgi:hypothetical protein